MFEVMEPDHSRGGFAVIRRISEIFLIIFVDVLFTKLMEALFTNAFNVAAES